jgi:hypothetical protein
MNKVEYERLKQEAEAEHRKNLEAIERVWRMSRVMEESRTESSNQINQADPARNGTEAQNNGVFLKGDLSAMVGRAVKDIPGPFSIVQLNDRLDRDHPNRNFQRPSIYSVLQKLIGQGELSIEIQGSGRSPTIYKRRSE